MLKQPTPSTARWIGGGTVVVVLALGVGFSAWSAQPKRELADAGEVPVGMLMTQMELSIDGGEPKQLKVISKPGEPFAMRSEHAGRQWEMQGTASPRGDGTIVIATTLSRDGKLVDSPMMVVREGKKATIEIGERNMASGAFKGIALEMVVTAAARVPPVPPAPPAPPAAMTAPAPAPPAPPAGVAPPPPPPLVLRRAGEVNRTPAPKYPAEAAAQGLGGKVMLVIDIDATGKPTNVEVEKSEPAGVFDQAAVDAVRQWQFKPGVENGKPVPGRVRVRVPVEFAPDPPVAPQGAVAPKATVPPEMSTTPTTRSLR